jgi:hypothetical protein
MKERDRLIVDDIQDTLEYNNQQHPNQKRFPGMTRLDVLKKHLNPNLPHLNKSLIYKYIGYETKRTSINDNQWFWCQDEMYMLPSPRILELLEPNNRTITAYWMPDANGEIKEAYVYQNGEYICTAEKMVKYNEAKAERTQEDWDAKLVQDKYVSRYDKYVKDGVSEYPSPATEKKVRLTTAEPVIITTSSMTDEEKQPVYPNGVGTEGEQAAHIDYAQKAMSDFFN